MWAKSTKQRKSALRRRVVQLRAERRRVKPLAFLGVYSNPCPPRAQAAVDRLVSIDRAVANITGKPPPHIA